MAGQLFDPSARPLAPPCPAQLAARSRERCSVRGVEQCLSAGTGEMFRRRAGTSSVPSPCGLC